MPVIVDRIESIATDAGQRASARVEAGGNTYDVWFQWPGPPCPSPADAFLALSIVPAMRLGTPLRIEGTVSERLLESSRQIQEVFRCWDRGLAFVDIQSAAVRASGGSASADVRGVGLTFTGGVDAFYTALKHQEEIDTLIFAYGLDVGLRHTKLRTLVSASLRDAASRLGKPLVEMETNLRTFTDPFLGWRLGTGAGLAAMGMMLSGRIRKMYLASGITYGQLVPDGTHPVLNRLFSTDKISFELDGCEFTRFEKIEAMRDNAIMLDTLRVCFHNTNNAYNCGTCEKCVRTMVALELAGALQRCRTFDQPLVYKRVARALPFHPELAGFVEDNLEAAIRKGASPRLIAALRRSVYLARARAAAHRLPPGPLRSVIARCWFLVKRLNIGPAGRSRSSVPDNGATTPS